VEIGERRLNEGPRRIIGLFVMGLCVVTFLLAAFSGPGIIPAARSKTKPLTEDEILLAGKWLPAHPDYCTLPFDGVLYEGPQVCRTCGTIKPPRSKHCPVMGGCVARYDHYCVWLNSAVGEHNYRWFLLYLVFHTIMLLYGAVATLSIFRTEIDRLDLFNRTFVNTRTNEEMKPGYWIIFQFLMSSYPELMLIQLLCTVMGVVLIGFTGYHLSLTLVNKTTNETFKYSGFATEVDKKRAIRDYAAVMRDRAKIPQLPAEDTPSLPTDGVLPNPFDRGMWENLKEVFFPLSLRSHAEWKRLDYGAPKPMTLESILAQGGPRAQAEKVFAAEMHRAGVRVPPEGISVDPSGDDEASEHEKHE
jgi:palmitoyltransferase ZDHHC4